MKVYLAYNAQFYQPMRYRVALNKGQYLDYDLVPGQIVEVGECEKLDKKLRPKKNKMLFRPVSPNEAAEARSVAASNVLRVFLFIIMIIFLPFAFMSFRSSRRPFAKATFLSAETDVFVVFVGPQGFTTGYYDPSFVMQQQEQFVAAYQNQLAQGQQQNQFIQSNTGQPNDPFN